MGGRKQDEAQERTQPRPYREVLAERRAAQPPPQGEFLPERDEDDEPVSPADEGADAQDEE